MKINYMGRIFSIINMVVSFVFLILGDVQRATYHLVLAVLVELERKEE